MDDMKKLLAGLVAIVAGIIYVTHAHAAAPQLKEQAPGYDRMLLGDFEIVALPDGTLGLPVTKLMTNTTPARVEQMLKRSFLAGPVETSVNGYLVNTGSRLVLIDAAAARFPQPSVTVSFDTDSKMAAVQRKKLYADAASQGFWLAAKRDAA
jgi:hypothetical protein